MARRFVVVSGPPASGKSTLAPVLAQQLALPLFAKDTVKDALMSTLGADDVEESRRLGQASVVVLYALARESPVGAVIESVFFRTVAQAELRRLPGVVVEVFCRCDRQLAERRYQLRAGSRHAGHLVCPDDRAVGVVESRALMRRSSCQGGTRSSSVARCSI